MGGCKLQGCTSIGTASANKCDCSITNGLNEVYVFSIKYPYCDVYQLGMKLQSI